MRRIGRIIGVLGGLGALIWAMRDRLISVAISREPQLPAFRVPEPMAKSPEQEPVAPTITDVRGIGPVYATRLAAAGINTVGDLTAADAKQLAEAADVPVAKAEGWIEAARGLHR